MPAPEVPAEQRERLERERKVLARLQQVRPGWDAKCVRSLLINPSLHHKPGLGRHDDVIMSLHLINKNGRCGEVSQIAIT